MQRRLQIFLVLGLAVLVAACLGPAVDPGPNPARMAVSVNFRLDPTRVRQAQYWQGPNPGAWTRFDNFVGPYWAISAQQLQEDGTWRRLPLAPGQPDMPVAYEIEVKRVFLAPPGPQDIRFRLEAFINRSWQELAGDPYVYHRTKDGKMYREYSPTWQNRSAVIYVLDLIRTRRLDPQAGQVLQLEPFK